MNIHDLGDPIVMDTPIFWFDFQNDYQYLPDPIKDSLLEHGLRPFIDQMDISHPWKVGLPDKNISTELVSLWLGMKEEIIDIMDNIPIPELEWYRDLYEYLEKHYS